MAKSTAEDTRAIRADTQRKRKGKTVRVYRVIWREP